MKILCFFLLLACSQIRSFPLRKIEDFHKAKYHSNYDKDLKGTLCFIGDAGHGTPNQFLVGKALADEACEHVWYLGDIIYPDGLKDANDTYFQKRFYDPYTPLIQNKNFKQFHMALGNHDHKGNPDAWTELSKIHPFIYAPHWYYLESWMNACFFVFDTDLYMRAVYEQRMQQNEWANHQLKSRLGSCPIAIAIAHHPYISSGGHGDSVGSLREFHEKYVIGHFDMLITGHDHLMSDEGIYQDTRLLISGAASEARLRLRHPYQKGYEGNTLGFIKLSFDQKNITYSFIEVTEVDKSPVRKVAFSQTFKAKGLR